MTDFDATRKQFYLPEDTVYLDGNSLGPLPISAKARLQQAMQEEWGEQLIRGWNTSGWMDLSLKVGDSIGRLIGAPAGSVMVGDTLSIKVYQALASALEIAAKRDEQYGTKRRRVISDSGNFPSDLYMADGLVRLLDRGYRVETPAPEDVESVLDESVAVLMLTEVDYATGRLHDMAALTRKAHDLGIVTVWDLAHSAGALPVDVSGTAADFAVGCTYKYLNGGPGAPAFIYIAPEHVDTINPALSGWLGHQAPFEFDRQYKPGDGIRRMRVGTPAVLSLIVLQEAMKVWEQVDMADIRRESQRLCDLFISDVEAACPELTLASPRDANQRGSQVSFAFEHGYALMQALIDNRVIGDFRAPDRMRFGFTPLYINESDVLLAVERLAGILRDRRWDQPRFHQRAAVT